MAAEILDNGAVVWYIRGVNLLWMDEGVIYDTPDVTLYFHNAHGDVVGMAGSFERQYRYDAFGNWESWDNNPFRYCGEYFDDETGTLYLRARRYDASIGRFTQQDTHWNPGNSIYGDNPHKLNEKSDPLGLNLYTYVPDTAAMLQSGNLYVYGMSNPVMFVDPSGKAIIDTLRGAWRLAQEIAMADGPSPFGDIVGLTIGILGTVLAGGMVIYHAVTDKKAPSPAPPKSVGGSSSIRMKNNLGNLNANDKRHILSDKHNWNRMVPNPNDPNNWGKIANIISIVLAHGSQSQYKNASDVFIKTYQIGKEIIQVTYRIIEGVMHISDAWIK